MDKAILAAKAKQSLLQHGWKLDGCLVWPVPGDNCAPPEW